MHTGQDGGRQRPPSAEVQRLLETEVGQDTVEGLMSWVPNLSRQVACLYNHEPEFFQFAIGILAKREVGAGS